MKLKPSIPSSVDTGMPIITEKWFSWGWLIFWMIVFFPIAIIYMLIKIGDRHRGRFNP